MRALALASSFFILLGYGCLVHLDKVGFKTISRSRLVRFSSSSWNWTFSCAFLRRKNWQGTGHWGERPVIEKVRGQRSSPFCGGFVLHTSKCSELPSTDIQPAAQLSIRNAQRKAIVAVDYASGETGEDQRIGRRLSHPLGAEITLRERLDVGARALFYGTYQCGHLP